VFEGGPRPETLASLRLIAAPTDTDNMPAATSIFGMSTVKEDGTFEIDGLVGGRALRLFNVPKNWYFKEVTREGADLTDKGYDFKPGEDVEGFDLVLTTKTQSVTGSVSNVRGEPAREYT